MKKTILNPFTSKEGFNCIGCSPNHPFGLKLHFTFDDSTKVVESEWQPNPLYQGYQNVLHGGIQATMLDEIASWVVYTVLGTSGVTSQLHSTYHKPVMLSNGPISLKAWVVKVEKRVVEIKAELLDHNGKLCTEATVHYFTFPEKISREKYGYPGREAFFSTSGDK